MMRSAQHTCHATRTWRYARPLIKDATLGAKAPVPGVGLAVLAVLAVELVGLVGLVVSEGLR